jgi:hypothetical protein
MNRKTAVIAIAIVALVVLSVLAVMFFGNSMYEWMLRVHHLR